MVFFTQNAAARAILIEVYDNLMWISCVPGSFMCVLHHMCVRPMHIQFNLRQNK